MLLCALTLVEVIQLETARRLFYTHNFTFSDIDKLSLFKFQMRAASNRGLIWYNTQRYLYLSHLLPTPYSYHSSDVLPWPAMHREEIPQLPITFIESNADLLQVVMKDMTAFCPRLNCLHTFCQLHGRFIPIHFSHSGPI